MPDKSPDTIRDERFARTQRLVGAEGMRRLQEAQVAVIGLGAVGSYATEGLARAGVGRLRLVDFDILRPSNRNRQLYALQSTEGRLKAEVAAARVRDINPDCEVETLCEFVHLETMDKVLAGPPDIVIDAIDSFTPKTELLTALSRRGIPVISSMGAAMRTDPSRIRVGPLSETVGCPLARQVRKRLRQRQAPLEFLCVYSTEPVDRRFVAHETDEAPAEEEYYERGRRRRTLGSLPTITGIFGLTAANAALRVILNET